MNLRLILATVSIAASSASSLAFAGDEPRNQRTCFKENNNEIEFYGGIAPRPDRWGCKFHWEVRGSLDDSMYAYRKAMALSEEWKTKMQQRCSYEVVVADPLRAVFGPGVMSTFTFDLRCPDKDEALYGIR